MLLLNRFAGSSRAHQGMGQHYFSTKEIDKAEQEHEQAICMRPYLPGLHLEVGQIYSSNSEWPKAEELFGQETQLQPGNAEAVFCLGDALMQQGKMREALPELLLETIYDLGKSALNLDPSEAERALLRVTQLEQESKVAAQACQALATLHRKPGKSELASKDMKKFQRIQAQVQQTAGKN